MSPRTDHTIILRLNAAPSRSYPIRIEPGLFAELPRIIERGWGDREVFIITDSTVRTLYGKLLVQAISEKHMKAHLIAFPPGEKSKNAKVILSLQTRLLQNGIRRDSLIVALGGGVVGDVAGFVAATVLRGVDYLQVPTTLLAQVDSCVGGKVGIDHPLGKNLIGAFHQPVGVYIDPQILRTLPVTEFRNGLAEMVKVAAALDGKLFRDIERNSARITKENVRLLSGLIAQSVSLKAAVVAKDEFDSDVRKTLNLGHTLGHAIEAASNYTITHGAAVAIGLAAESKIAMRMGLLKERDYRRLIKVLRALKLRTTFPRIRNISKFFTALAADKKSEGGTGKFVLLKSIGHTVIGADVPTPFISEL